MRGVVCPVVLLRRNVGRNVLTLLLRPCLRFAELEFALLEMAHATNLHSLNVADSIILSFQTKNRKKYAIF